MENFINVVPLGQGGGISSAFHSFWNQISSWDFSLLKWVLIALPILFVLFIVYAIFRGWLRVTDDGTFGDGYGLRIVTGVYGSGKTKYSFQAAYEWKKNNPDGILIANLDYDFVNFYFNSKKDLDFVLKDLVKYIYDTNNTDDLKKNFDFPPIKLIIDEAHLYFFARDFKTFTKDALLVLTQCRKRELGVDFITQEFGQLDVFIRRLAPFVQYFEKAPLGFTRESIQYCNNPETTSLRDTDSFDEEDMCYFIPGKYQSFFKPSLKEYYTWEFMTKKVIGKGDVYCTTESEDLECSYRYQEFKEFMDQKIKDWRSPLPPRKTIFDRFFKKESPELQEEIINKQKEMINKLLKFVPESELESLGITPDTSQRSGEVPGHLDVN